MENWTLDDLEKWDRKIEAKAKELGLDFYPQEFEICNYHDMLGYEAYIGIPSHYPHWSYGKRFEKQRTLYRYGVVGLPYEMVINSNPSLAYLMLDNSLALQILTIAHVYGHNDFFKNNNAFAHTKPEFVLNMFKLHANRVRSYIEDPGIGYAKVENILDAAHAISLQCNRYKQVKIDNDADIRKKMMEKLRRDAGRWDHLKEPEPEEDMDFHRIPLEPEYDILLFIRDHHPFLDDWQRDLITIVREETDYFMPQIETKIMNEGWASFFHYHILQQLDLPEALYWEFIKAHNQVIRPHLGQINPYHLGYEIYNDICRRENKLKDDDPIELCDKIFEIRKVDRDAAFLRRYLTKKLMGKLNLFEYSEDAEKVEITELSDEKGWKKVRDTLVQNTGFNAIPVIRVEEVKFGSQQLMLQHEFDGRELQMDYLRNTLKYIHQIWGREVILHTTFDDKPHQCIYNEEGFEADEL